MSRMAVDLEKETYEPFLHDLYVARRHFCYDIVTLPWHRLNQKENSWNLRKSSAILKGLPSVTIKHF